jgi:nitrite reductase/ring-hydroxylating ferredoxin subunit
VRRNPIALVSELSEGQSLKFEITREGKRVAGVLFCFKGQLLAYENRCQHLPLPLDYGDNRFFTKDGRHLRCQMHGAVYEPTTGVCVRGPCFGARLAALPIEIARGKVWLALGLAAEQPAVGARKTELRKRKDRTKDPGPRRA